MPCQLVSSLLGLCPEDWGSKLLRNVGNYYLSCLTTLWSSLRPYFILKPMLFPEGVEQRFTRIYTTTRLHSNTYQKTVTCSLCFTLILTHLSDFPSPQETQFLVWNLISDIHLSFDSTTAGGNVTHTNWQTHNTHIQNLTFGILKCIITMTSASYMQQRQIPLNSWRTHRNFKKNMKGKVHPRTGHEGPEGE